MSQVDGKRRGKESDEPLRTPVLPVATNDLLLPAERSIQLLLEETDGHLHRAGDAIRPLLGGRSTLLLFAEGGSLRRRGGND